MCDDIEWPLKMLVLWFMIMFILFIIGFRRCCEQEDNAWQYFQRRILNKISVERLIFYKSGTSLYLKQGKLLAKSGQNKSVIASSKPVVAISELQCDCASTKNNQSNKKCYFNPYLNISSLKTNVFILTKISKIIWGTASTVRVILKDFVSITWSFSALVLF